MNALDSSYVPGVYGWLKHLPAPRRTWLVHGERSALQAFRLKLEDALGWSVRVAQDGQTVRLSR